MWCFFARSAITFEVFDWLLKSTTFVNFASSSDSDCYAVFHQFVSPDVIAACTVYRVTSSGLIDSSLASR